MNQKQYLSAREASDLLDVSIATLYAYVSRGLIRSEGVSANKRARRYLAQDVQLLADRKAQRRDPTIAAQDALHWGMPVLDSALTLISDNKLYYRGLDACELAKTRSFEAVAALLWSGETEINLSFAPTLPFQADWLNVTLLQSLQSPISAMQVALTIAAEHDLNAYMLTTSAVGQTGARILWLLAYVLAVHARGMLNDATDSGIAGLLANAWNTNAVETINAALILCADHELNASTFTTRVIASTEANLYSVIIGGLAAIQGFRHGGYTRRVSAFLREIEGADARERTGIIRAWLQRGDPIPGFGHPLYAQGDPRAVTLLDLLDKGNLNADSREFLGVVQDTARKIEEVTEQPPTIDFALAVMERVLHLPADSALAVFALGRTAGWIGHAMEQYSTKQLIRPRAKYVGRQPD